MRMPFGKHRGKELTKVPKRYLRWCEKNLDLREPLATAVRLALRGEDYNAPACAAVDPDAEINEICKPWTGE